MAEYVEVSVIVRAVVGTGECAVCNSLVSWKFDFGAVDDERLASIRCPRCKGTVEVDPDSVVMELDYGD